MNSQDINTLVTTVNRRHNRVLERKSTKKTYSYLGDRALREYLMLHDKLTQLWYRAIYAEDGIAQRIYHLESVTHKPAMQRAMLAEGVTGDE